MVKAAVKAAVAAYAVAARGAPTEPLMKHRSEIGRRLDQAEIVGQGQQAFAQGPYAGPDFDDLAANVGTNHIGDPIVETRHLRDDFEFAGKKSVHGDQQPENCQDGIWIPKAALFYTIAADIPIIMKTVPIRGKWVSGSARTASAEAAMARP